jgi:hypothetical protein
MGSSLTFKFFVFIFTLNSVTALCQIREIIDMKQQEAKINAQKFELEIKKSNLEIEILNYQIQAIKGDGQ